MRIHKKPYQSKLSPPDHNARLSTPDGPSIIKQLDLDKVGFLMNGQS